MTLSTSAVALEARDLHFSYKAAPKKRGTSSGQSASSSEVLKGLSFQVAFGRITGLLGPNGSGKSTSFKILSTQLLPSHGEAFVCGQSVATHSAEARASLGVTFQSPSLDPILTIRENLEIHAALMGVSKSEAPKRIEKRLKELSIWDRRDSRVKELSGGLARRAELAKTLLADPKVLLLDEPTTGLDPSSRREFWTLLRSLVAPTTAILVTTHLMEEAEMCDELLFISDGRVAAQGTPDSLKNEFGAEVLLLEGSDLASLREKVAKFLGAEAQVSVHGPGLRVEGARISLRLESLRGELGDSLSGFHWSRGTLADIYLRKTGKELVNA